MGRPNRGTGSAGPKKPNPPINRPQYGNDNLVVAQVKKYPNVFSGVEIGGGTIKINIPSFDKQLVFDYNDIETFKQNILN